jgi:hypothetical protein
VPDTRVRVADFNADGKPDIVLTASEGVGRLSWFEAPAGLTATTGQWREHHISEFSLEGAHSLAVADLDNDGDLDVVTAEMHTSHQRRVLTFINDGTPQWRVQTLSNFGSHNLVAADVDGDGDDDLVGKNYAGPGRVVEWWRNLSRDNFGAMSSSTAPFVAPGWRYVSLDANRGDDQQGTMGLIKADVNRDGRPDVVAGSMLYLNPGGRFTEPWPRVRVGSGVDTFFAVDVDGDSNTDLVAMRGDALLWLEADGATAASWTERRVAQIRDARTQGYVLAQIVPGGRDELVFTRGTTLSYVRLPDDPIVTPWPTVVVSTETEEEGVAAIDVDHDGDLDLVATGTGTQTIVWLENDGTRDGHWRSHLIGRGDGGERWFDRVLAADMNLDGRMDVVVSEETQDWTYNASVYWFEAPADPVAEEWPRHAIAVLRSINSLDVVDVDRDGDMDVIAAEHTDMRSSQGAPNNLTVIYENSGAARFWIPHPIEAGPHSSHLGAQAWDLDGDGRVEVVSTAWNQFRNLHVWVAD